VTYQETLDLSADEFDALSERLSERTYEGRRYRHLPDYRSRLNRGLVLTEDEVVRGFPKIPRALVLREGIPNQFDDELVVEEKLNGYNVRVAFLDEPIAFTRSGIACPFSTYVVRDQLDLESFFEAHPELMLCGEMVGPRNPYTAHAYPGVEDVAFRAFDVRHRETGEPLGVPERRERCEAFDIPQVPYHGRFTVEEALDAVPVIVDELDEAGREGVVMKTPDVSKQLKYTTGFANQDDLAYAFSLPFDYGQEFMFRRLIREGFQSAEWGEDDAAATERAHELGEAILLSMREAIDAVDRDETLGERHTVTAPPTVVESLLAHLRDQGLKLELESDETTDGSRTVTFLKKTQSTNDKIRSYLDGQIVRE
jgi:putative ATP-dependent DNA ligase